MSSPSLQAVTGSFGYSGKYITRRLLSAGHSVITLTNSPRRDNPFGNTVKPFPLAFEDSKALARTLEGVSVLYNTYWVRFNHPSFTHASAVQNTRALFQAARQAGVQRVVHISITNPSEDSPLEYFRGKALLERALMESGLSHAILRPTVLFGEEDILINNIAWILRRLPVFGVFGDGQYRLQPIYVDDLAELAVREGQGRGNVVLNAIGPETFTFRELVQAIARALGKSRPFVSVSPRFGFLAASLLGWLVRDVVITREEIQGLMAGLLYVDTPPTGSTRLTDWAREHAKMLGRKYASELARRSDRITGYEGL